MTKKQKKTLWRILGVGAVFAALLVLHYTGVFEGLPRWLEFLCYLLPYLVIGYDVLWTAARNIVRGNLFEENFLMGVATLAAFALGLFGEGEYPEALAVMLFYQVGEFFQSLAVGRSRRSIAAMMELAPESANLLTEEGECEETDPEEVPAGSLILIRPGEKIPLDGVVVEGESYLDTAALTGESVPRSVRAGDEVISGCVNGASPLTVRTTKEYEDSTVARILELVENATSQKARLENFITRFAKYYTPVVTVAAVLLALAAPLLFHASWEDGIRRACNFLIVSCPCALVISVPLGFFGGIGAASKVGVLVKGSNFLEAAAELDTLVLDKTGTLTRGEFKVAKVLPAAGFTADELLELAAAGESVSTHPIARSICDAWKGPIDRTALGPVEELSGRGIKAEYRGKPLLLGNLQLMAEQGLPVTPHSEAGTVVYAAYGGAYAGCVLIRDVVKDGAAEAIAALRQAGIRRTVMLTGDRKEAAEAVARELGIDEVRYELLPEDKVTEVERFIRGESASDPRQNKVGFVGDGINDAPVLMRSDVGFAMGSLGSDAAIEAADIVLMDDDIRKIPLTIRIARKTMAIVKTNVAFALAVKGLILLLSALGFASMWAAVFGDVGVALLCVLNSMRTMK